MVADNPRRTGRSGSRYQLSILVDQVYNHRTVLFSKLKSTVTNSKKNIYGKKSQTRCCRPRSEKEDKECEGELEELFQCHQKKGCNAQEGAVQNWWGEQKSVSSHTVGREGFGHNRSAHLPDICVSHPLHTSFRPINIRPTAVPYRCLFRNLPSYHLHIRNSSTGPLYIRPPLAWPLVHPQIAAVTIPVKGRGVNGPRSMVSAEAFRPH